MLIFEMWSGAATEFDGSDIPPGYTDIAPPSGMLAPTFRDGVWVSAVASPMPTPEAPAPESPKVSPVEFKLLFTAQERVAIKAARENDPVIDDFYEILDDPRLTYVDLGLQSTRDSLDYLVQSELITEGRRDQILTGVIL